MDSNLYGKLRNPIQLFNSEANQPKLLDFTFQNIYLDDNCLRSSMTVGPPKASHNDRDHSSNGKSIHK